MNKAILEAVIEEIEAAGLQWELSERGRRPKVIVTINGRPYPFSVSLSSSDHRAAKNARCQVRQTIARVRSTGNPYRQTM